MSIKWNPGYNLRSPTASDPMWLGTYIPTIPIEENVNQKKWSVAALLSSCAKVDKPPSVNSVLSSKNCFELETVQLLLAAVRLRTAARYFHTRYTRTRRAVYYITPPWGGLPSSIARQPRGCQYRTMRLREAPGEMFPMLTFSASALFRPWRYRAWKVGPEGCDIRRRIWQAIVDKTVLEWLLVAFLAAIPGSRALVCCTSTSSSL